MSAVFVVFSFMVDKGVFRSFDHRTAFWLKDHVSIVLAWFFAVVCRTGNAEITVPAGILIAAWGIVKKRGNGLFGGFWIFWLVAGIALEHFLKLHLLQPHPTRAVLNDPLRGFQLIHIPLPFAPGSYPSGHTFRAFWLAFLVAESAPGWLRLTKVWAILVMGGVIALGWHWATDTAGGLIFAFMGATLLGRFRRS